MLHPRESSVQQPLKVLLSMKDGNPLTKKFFKVVVKLELTNNTLTTNLQLEKGLNYSSMKELSKNLINTSNIDVLILEWKTIKFGVTVWSQVMD